MSQVCESLMRICDVTFGDNGGSVGLDGVEVVLLQLLLLFLLLLVLFWFELC